MWKLALVSLSAFLLVGAACSDGDDDGGGATPGPRQVEITQAEDGCTPPAIDAEPGENLKLVVVNTTAKVYELETEDERIEEFLNGGETVTLDYTAPGEGTETLECYSPEGGPRSVIEVRVVSGLRLWQQSGRPGWIILARAEYARKIVRYWY